MNSFTHMSLTSTALGRGSDLLVFVVVSRGVHVQVLMEYQYVHAFSSERHWRCQQGGLRDSARGAEPRGHRTKKEKKWRFEFPSSLSPKGLCLEGTF